MAGYGRLLQGVGINDANYQVVRNEEYTNHKGKKKFKQVWRCPYYWYWKNMLKRCYSPASLRESTSYVGCSVCEEWHLFSNFKSWMEQQDWEGKQLDKDLLVYQNKVYSPENCCFIPNHVNGFLTSAANSNHLLPIGTQSHKQAHGTKYTARIGHKGHYLGIFTTPHEAHRAWQKAKFTQAFELASQETGVVQQGLLRVANKIKDDYDNNLETKDF